MLPRDVATGAMPRAVITGAVPRTAATDAMRRALVLARRGPADNPNPQVGCVILDPNGLIVSEGFHRGAGTPHAEVDALSRLPEEWRLRPRELTAVVTLEPCNHTGRTGPCTRALSEFSAGGIGAVVYALNDPGQASSGGAKTLRANGIEVVSGVLADEAREVLEAWLAKSTPRRAPSTPPSGQQTAQGSQGVGKTLTPSLLRPHVTVKWAQTLDGRAAAADGSSQWITGPDARADVHRRRAEADAILVGTGTLFADDPALTARAENGTLLVPAYEQPIPVVIGHRSIPANARVQQHPALAAHNLSGPLQFSGDDLDEMLATLHGRGIRHLFVEGGPSMVSSLITEDLVDEVLVYVAPALLGGPRLALVDIGVTSMPDIKRLQILQITQLGEDLCIRASPVSPSSSPAAQQPLHSAPNGQEDA